MKILRHAFITFCVSEQFSLVSSELSGARPSFLGIDKKTLK